MAFGRACFEVDAPASDQHCIIRAIGQVDNFGANLSRETEQTCSPTSLRDDLPSLPSGYGARGLNSPRSA
jgi:hypothetical protein